jgi:hypothetical protein
MFFAAFPILSIEPDEIANVVRENGSLLVGRVFKLLSVGFASALQIQHVYRVVTPLAENIGEQGPNILVKQNNDLRH